MRDYQIQYIGNLKQVQELMDVSGLDRRDVDQFYRMRRERQLQSCELIQENTSLLRKNLMPVLDNIVSLPESEADELVEFAVALAGGFKQLDLVLGYTIHDALVTYARHWKKRDLLIQELYYAGLALFYMQSRISATGKHLYNWKIGLMFGEAASYIRQYDEIENPDTRGFIHRAMANLALSYQNAEDQESRKKKAEIIRRSLQVLTDPVYQEKTPSLPWDLFIYKSHQERTTLMTLLRSGTEDARIVREVMESSQFVWDRQQENSKKKGTPLSVRWTMEYEMALYHCGLQPLTQLLQHMEEAYMERDTENYTDDGVYANILHVGLYSDYLKRDEELVRKKKEVLMHMYRMLTRYVQNAPNNMFNEGVTRNLLETMKTFIEYPDGTQYKDFLLQLVVCRDSDSYVFVCKVADLSAKLMRAMIQSAPELLVGALGTLSVEDVVSRQDELVQFAYDSGMLHDAGMIAFGGMVRNSARSWLEDEYTMYGCHAFAGYEMLRQCDSTRPYAQTALGHNVFYNGTGGYPDEYKREENAEAVVTDIVSVAAYLFRLTTLQLYSAHKLLPLEEAVNRICEQSGERFSPKVCSLLQEIKADVDIGIEREYREVFRRLF